MALPILMLAGTLLRATGPTIAKELAKLGAKKATKKALQNAPKNIRTISSKNIKNVKKTRKEKQEGVLASRKTKQKMDKATSTKKKVAGSTVPKVVAATSGAGVLTTIIAKKKDGSAKAGAMPKSRPKSIKPKNFGMGMVDDFGKGRKKGSPEGGTAPIKPKKKKSDVSQGSTMAKTPKKAKPITAGSNVGFGPKGNIFPKDAADRKRLMNKYGGTGSAAAKAAAQGKQGNLKKVGRT